MKPGRRYLWALGALLAAAVLKLWILPLRSSFWVDEMVTAFVVHYGPSHPSLAVAPQVSATIYYWLPWAAERMFGFSETIYRLPSTVLMGLSLFLLARLAMRLIHPGAAWFVVFAAMTLNGINYQADDARPYALATCAAAGAALFVVRWLDDERGWDAFLYVICAALLWRVHLMEWPFYVVLSAYVLARVLAGDTRVSPWRIVIVHAILAAALIPVLLTTFKLLAETQAHVIFPQPPAWREFRGAFKFLLVIGAGAGAWLLSLKFRWARQKSLSWPAFILIAGWWITQPVALFAFSRITGDNIFVPRYLWLSLPGAALAATAAAAYFVPDRAWKPSAAVLGTVVLLFTGGIPRLAPLHHNSNWRAAASAIRREGVSPNTPVLYPSPFIEAQSPVWQPNYPLPSFLYCQLLTYPVGGTPVLLPYAASTDVKQPEAERYAATISATPLSTSSKFVIYGGDTNVKKWQRFFAARPELAGWRIKTLGTFGDVAAVVFEPPDAGAKLFMIQDHVVTTRGTFWP
jgi:hypothetical protein